MKKSLITIYRNIVPEKLRDFLFEIRQTEKLKKLQLEEKASVVISYLKEKQEITPDEKVVLDYLLKNPKVTTFPYENMNQSFHVEVQKDTPSGLYYSLFEGKKLYFKKQTTKKANKDYLNGLLNEQLDFSPHRYLTKDFKVDSNTILADIGSAEGNFALSVIDRIKKLYIFESDPDWILSLKQTFAPWKDKVVIENILVSNEDSSSSTTLDTYFKFKEKPTFLKMDIEGYEDMALAGAQDLLDNSPMQIAMCTYHKNGDDVKFKNYLEQKGFSTSFSDGYMFFLEDSKNFSPPYFRKGLIRAIK